MYKLLVVGTVLAVASAHIHPINEAIIQEIKERATTWWPMEIEENPLHKLTIEQVKGLLGTHVEEQSSGPYVLVSPDGAPASFDSRTAWPGCVHAIRDQAACGSCWAFGASEALSDRFCVAGKANVVLSPQDLVSCDKADMACNGGWLNVAWTYIQNNGLVPDANMPYTSGGGAVAACPPGRSSWTKYFASPIYSATNPEAIKTEVAARGPMETQFNVYSDFMNYGGGIYVHTSGYLEGGHAVKLIGWGVSGSQKYWICANSWGPVWGESGFFRIQEGQVGIDSNAWAGTPGTIRVFD